MKTLYISDLDGTLLNSDARVSDYSKNAINGLIDGGMNFSIATARTAATVTKILEDVHVDVPVVLMNGVCVYDLRGKKYIKMESIPFSLKQKIMRILKAHGASGFLYSVDNGVLSTFYENTDSPNARAFMRERQKKFGKVFTKVNDFTDCIGNNMVYYSVSDTREKLEPLYLDLSRERDLHIEYYRDVYHEDFWYLEICSRTASKRNAVNFLRRKYGYERVIGFGDNLNDLPLFEASDECYAVGNAKPEIKKKAWDTIDANNEDGVAKWLMKYAKGS